MPIAKSVMRQWMTRATLPQKKALAKAAKTTLPHLHHLTSGRRGVKADLAQRLAAASHTLGHRALYLDQRELCSECSACPLVSHPTPLKTAKPKIKKPVSPAV